MTTINVGSSPFLRGTATAIKVLEAHQGIDFPDERSRVACFWFYVGALAAGEYDYAYQNDLSLFLAGAAVRAPEPPDVEVTFTTDHEMFEGDDSDSSANMGTLLRRVASDIDCGVTGGVIRATDGKVLGKFEVRS